MSAALGGGIADEPCPTVAGEHTNTCAAGTVGVPYHVRFRENEGSGCGPGRQTFHLDSGALPAGLVLATDGTLSGTPLAPGRFRFYVQMREPQNDPGSCAGKRTEKQFALWVRLPLTVEAVPAAPPPLEVGVPVRLRLRARGGSTVYAWRALNRGLPAGVRLRGDGSLTGVPRRAGTYNVRIRVRDTDARVAEWSRAVNVVPRLALASRALPRAAVGRAYDALLPSQGGVAPVRWTAVTGRLPLGVRLRPDGRLVGTPRAQGRFVFLVRARDRLGATVTASLRLDVAGQPR